MDQAADSGYLIYADSRMAKLEFYQHLNTRVYHRPNPSPNGGIMPHEREVSRFTRGNVIFRIVVDDDEEELMTSSYNNYLIMMAPIISDFCLIA